MPGPIRIRRSTTSGAVPASLLEGEFAINIPDRRLYFRGPTGAVESFDLRFSNRPTNFGSARSAVPYEANVNADTINTVGESRFINPSGSANIPFTGYGYVALLGGGDNGNRGVQVAADPNDFWWREFSNPTIWKRFWHSGNFDPNSKANVASPTFTGTGTFGNSGNNGSIAIDGASGSWRVLDFRHAGVLNWRIQARGDGDRHFQISAFDNAGVWLRDVLTINRLTGAWTLNGTTNVVGDMGVAGTIWMRGAVVQNGTNGYVALVSGVSDRPGYLAWHTVEGTRRAYMGWKSADRNAMMLHLENGWGLDIVGDNGAVRFNTIPLFRGNIGGSEGGEIWIARPLSGTALAGDVAIDINGNRWRMFESGGSYRGVFIDFTTCGSQSEIWHDGNAPAYIRDASLRPRHAWDNSAFRTAVVNGTDATAALNTIFSQGGRIRFPDQGERIKITGRPVIEANGVIVEGSKEATIIELNGSTSGIDIGAQHRCVLSGLRMIAGAAVGSGGVIPASSAIRTLTGTGVNCYDTLIEDVLLDHVFTGIDISSATRTTIRNCDILNIYGTAAINMVGTSTINCDLLSMSDVIINNAATVGFYPSNMKGDYFGLTAYSLGDIVSYNSRYYQCVQAGSTGHPLLNPFDATPDGTPTSKTFNDAGVVWRLLCRTTAAGVQMGSWARTLDAKSLGVITLPYGFRMVDTLLVANSQPIWAYLDNCDFDHNIINNVWLQHGQDFRAGKTYASSTKLSNAVRVDPGYKGEGGYYDGVIRNAATQGVVISAPFTLRGNDIINNGQAAANNYDNVYVNANVPDVTIVDNKFLPNVGATTQNARRPITVATGTADRLKIALNTSRGHGTSNAILNNSTGTGQIVVNNT